LEDEVMCVCAPVTTPLCPHMAIRSYLPPPHPPKKHKKDTTCTCSDCMCCAVLCHAVLCCRAKASQWVLFANSTLANALFVEQFR